MSSNVLWSGGRGKINERDGGKFGERLSPAPKVTHRACADYVRVAREVNRDKGEYFHWEAVYGNE